MPDESRYYWDDAVFANGDEMFPFGENTARIIDEAVGGVIAYCHSSNADMFVEALRGRGGDA